MVGMKRSIRVVGQRTVSSQDKETAYRITTVIGITESAIAG
jgi:hypothetical protein